MGTFSSFGLNPAYHERYEKLGDRLSDVGKTLDWDVFRPLLESMYANKSGKGGHPNVDVLLMFKIQLLEVWYNLSDLAVEREIYDRLSFWHFLGCPDKIPDNSTIWLFRERMAESGVDTLVWQEFQRQLDLKGLKIEQGSAQGKALLSDSGFHPSLCFRMQRLFMLNPVIVRKTRREEIRQKHDGIKMEKSCPRMEKYTMAINFIPSWIRRTILFDALKPPRQMFMIVR
jgi:hypothetical protein